ncbi:MAG TPA: S9 family peptidase [Candidatus Deferrimicrobium sp.]|nr:S9 family peptidase [Candidatus Deferrimicrobium sp.]
MNKRIIFLMLMVMSYFGFLAFSADVTPDNFSIATMFQDKFLSQLPAPQYLWLQNGKVLLLDSRFEPSKRTFELLDPADGKRTPIIEPAKILASFKKDLGQEAPESLAWPDAFDTTGKRALYILAGDLFLVELETGNIERLTQTPGIEKSAAFSPDGEWISFIRDNDIYAVERKSGVEKRLTTGATATLLNGTLSWVYWEEIYDHTVIPYEWSPDSSSIAYLQSDDANVPISTFVHFKPVNEEVVLQRYPKAGQSNPKVRLGIVEIASAATTWIDCGDYEYLARFNWLPNGRAIAVQTMNRQQSDLKLFLADKKTGKSKLLLEEKSPAWINLHDSLYFFKNSDRFIWLSERDGYSHLYLYSLDGRLIQQLTKGEYRVLPSDRGVQSKFGGLAGVDEKKGLVYFTSNRDALKERHLYRVNLDGKGLKRLSAGQGVHGTVFSPDMKYYLDNYSSASQPEELGLFNADGTKRLEVTPAAMEILAPWNLVNPEFYTFKTDDGLDLPIMMTKPVHFDPTKKYPALIYVYGGPTAQQVLDSWSSRRAFWYNRLGREGFFTFVVEVRAGLGKNRDIETSAYKQAYGMQNVKDILAGVKWIKEKSYIDPDRIGLWGGSGGGCTTIYTMTHTDVFKAGVSLFPVSDWNYYDSIYTERFLNTPQENPEGYRDTSAVLTAPNLKGRLLIAHGTYDDNVHPQNTWAFINELIAKNIQFELMIYPWRKHGISDYPGRVHLYTLMLEFWKKNL